LKEAMEDDIISIIQPLFFSVFFFLVHIHKIYLIVVEQKMPITAHFQAAQVAKLPLLLRQYNNK